MGPLVSRHSPPSKSTAQIVGRRGQVEKKVLAANHACLAVCTSAPASLCAQLPCLMRRPQSQTQCCLPAHPPSLGAHSCTLRLQTRNWN